MESATEFILCNRTSPRWVIPAEQEAWVELELERHVYRQRLHDIGPHGLSFLLPEAVPAPERDALFQDVTVHVDGLELSGHLAVSHVLTTDEPTRLCGARLIPADHGEQVKLDGLLERLGAAHGSTDAAARS